MSTDGDKKSRSTKKAPNPLFSNTSEDRSASQERDHLREVDLSEAEEFHAHVEDSLNLRVEKHDPLIHSQEGKIETTFGTRDKEYRKTYDEVFNESTLKTIYHLFQRKILSTVEYPISTGKEANVFLGFDIKQEPVAIKIFRESTTSFRKVRPYIEGDPRFKHILRNRRGIVSIWAKKEFKNLKRMEHAGVRVPEALGIERNVLVMTYIGDDSMAAPTLRNWWNDHKNEDEAIGMLKLFYEDLMEQMRLINIEAGLVHSDLSEFNILIFEEKPYIIDVGQAVVHSHPMSGEFLTRDIHNFTAFFKRNGIDAEENELMDFINRRE